VNIWLIDHYTNPPQDLGDARHFSNARELIRRGHEVRVIACTFNHLTHTHFPLAPEFVWKNDIYDDVPFTLIRACSYQTNFEMARIWNMYQFAFRARRGEWAEKLKAPDLVLGSSPDPFVALAAQRLAARYHVPFVMEIRDLWPYSIIAVTGRSKYHPFIQAMDWTQRYLYARAARILMLSRNSTELLVQSGANREKIEWIPHGVDLSMNPEPRPAPDDGVFTVTYLGAHNEWNSLGIVLDAAKLLQNSGTKNVMFRFVGDGSSKPALIEKTKAENIRNVRFDNPVAKKMVYEVQHNSDAFIINNREDEASINWMSFNKLYDYLAAGRPVIFGTCTSNDPVRESGAGISVEAGDPKALAKAVQFLSSLSREQLFEYGKLGRRFIETNYSIPVLVDRFEAMARALTKGSGSGSSQNTTISSSRASVEAE
jgi:glycosyltransferase involved in cell wall biosynthesis